MAVASATAATDNVVRVRMGVPPRHHPAGRGRRSSSKEASGTSDKAVGSMSRRNIFWLPQRSVDGAYGTIELVGIFGFAEAGALGAMEAWAVVERHCSSVREAPGLDLQG